MSIIDSRSLLAPQCFVTVIETGGFAAAARKLGIAQSTVSRQVSLLEQRVKTPLLVRTTRSVRPTEAGRFYLDRARIALATLAEAEHGASSVGAEPEGTLRVTMSESYGRRVIAPVLADFAKRHPLLRLDLDLSDETRSLDRGAFDLAIRLGSSPAKEPSGVLLASHPLIVVVAPELVGSIAIDDPDALEVLPTIVLNDPRPRTQIRFTKGGQDRLLSFEPTHTTSDTEVARLLALAGLGVTVLPEWLVAEDLRTGRLIPLLPDWQLPCYPVRAITPSPVLAKASAALLYLSEIISSSDELPPAKDA